MNKTATATQLTANAILGKAQTVYVDHGQKQYIQIIDSLKLSSEDKEKLKSPEFLARLPEGSFAIDFTDVRLPALLSLEETKVLSEQIALQKKQELLPKELYLIVAKLGKLDLRTVPLAPPDTINGRHMQITRHKKFGLLKKVEPFLSKHYMASTEGTIILLGAIRPIEKPQRVPKQQHFQAFDTAAMA